MLTYAKTVEQTLPRLVIECDEYALSPREYSENIGTLAIEHRDFISPDGTDNVCYQAMIATADDATSTADHIERMKSYLADTDLAGCDILPVNLYDHSGTVYRLGEAHGFDTSACGFYFVPSKFLPQDGKTTQETKDIIADELKDFTAWANGDVYQYTLHDDNGDEIEREGNIYGDIDQIKNCLSDEWKDENLQDYFKN